MMNRMTVAQGVLELSERSRKRLHRSQKSIYKPGANH